MKLLFGTLFLSLATPAVATNTIGTYNRGKMDKSLSLFQIFKSHGELVTSVSPEGFQFGTPEMGDALLRIGSWAQELTHKPLKIGDISIRRGGKMAQHTTHQIGLDADIGYLTASPSNTGHRFKRFHNRFTEVFEKHRKTTGNFDVALNYPLFKKIVDELPVKTILVGCGILNDLKTYDDQQPGSIMKKVRGHALHTDHFHMRLHCPQADKNCSEKWWVKPKSKYLGKKKGPKKNRHHCS
jgi:penicillin-insensitive murein endopeptidase